MKAKTIIKRILKILYRHVLPLILLFIAGVTLYSVISSAVNSNQMAMPFGYGLGYPMSGSMEPTLDVEDLIVVHKTDDYEVGDIVVFSSGSSLVVHRIIDIQTMKYKEYEENCLGGAISDPVIENKGEKPNDPNRDVVVVTTKGDWEKAAPDKPILESKIQGEVIHIFDDGRIIVDILQSPIVMILLGGIAIYLLQASFKKQKKEDLAELEALEAEIRKLTEQSDNLTDENSPSNDCSAETNEKDVLDNLENITDSETKENADFETKGKA